MTDPDHGIASTFKPYSKSIARNIAANIRRISENSDPNVDEIDDWVITHFKKVYLSQNMFHNLKALQMKNNPLRPLARCICAMPAQLQ